MEKFNRILRGYDPEEVNAYLDKVIAQVESMVAQLKQKNVRIVELESINQELQKRLEAHTKMEDTLNRAIIMAQKTSDQMKMSAVQESEMILEDAKNNANRIVNEALLRSEKVEYEASQLKRNINVFKRRLSDIIQSQLDMVDDIEKVDF